MHRTFEQGNSQVVYRQGRATWMMYRGQFRYDWGDIYYDMVLDGEIGSEVPK